MANTYNICNKLQAIADAITQGGGGGGGTTVIANPTGTPTADLNTIQIGQTIYDIPGGGGGGNVYDRTVLATPNTVTPGEISLSDNINNFDDLEIIISFPGNTSKSAFRISADYFMTEFPYVSGATPSDNHLLCCLYDTYYVRLIMGSANNKMYMIETSTIYLEEIAGIKYISRGGGSDQAIDINYDNTTSGLTADNVQDAIDENADNISTLNSKLTVTRETIKTGLVIERYGNMRRLNIENVGGNSAGTLTKLTATDRPNQLTHCITCYMMSGSTVFSAYLIIDPVSGNVNARYYSGTTDQSAGTLPITGYAVWFV